MAPERRFDPERRRCEAAVTYGKGKPLARCAFAGRFCLVEHMILVCTKHSKAKVVIPWTAGLAASLGEEQA